MLCYALLATPVSGDNSGMMKLTESYGALERVALWQRSLSWLPGGHPDGTFVTWPKPAIVWAVRAAMLGMFAIHAVSFRSVWRARSVQPWRWIVGPIGAQLIMLLMVPSNADVFFYAISGDIANHGTNPYATPLYDVFQNPLYAYNHWVDMTTVYGPVWTLISQGVVAVTGPDPARAVLGFKVLLGAVALMVTASTYWAARLLGVSPARSTAAMVLVGWQPNIIMEAAGQAHNDIVMIAFVLAAVMLILAGAGRALRGSIVVLAIAAAVKYVSLPLLGLFALVRLAQRPDERLPSRLAAAWVLDGLGVLAVLVASFAPYWTGPSMVSEMLTEPGRLYSNPIWLLPASLIRSINAHTGTTFEGVTRAVAQVAAVGAILVVLAQFAVYVWRSSARDADGELPKWTSGILNAWAAIFAILAFVPVNTHAWYWTWPVVPIALLVVWEGRGRSDPRPANRWLIPWMVATALLTLVYHTRIVHPG